MELRSYKILIDFSKLWMARDKSKAISQKMLTLHMLIQQTLMGEMMLLVSNQGWSTTDYIIILYTKQRH